MNTVRSLSLENAQLVSIRELTKALGVTRVTIWRWVNNKDFPPGIQVSKGRKAWLAKDVDAWLQRKF